MKLMCEGFEKFKQEKGWGNRVPATKLGIEYSYYYRVKTNTRSVGKKFLMGLLEVLRDERTRVLNFLWLENEGCFRIIMKILNEYKLTRVIPLLKEYFYKMPQRDSVALGSQ